MWYRKPSKPGRHPLPGSDHTERELPYLPTFQARTSAGLTTLVLTAFSFPCPFHTKANQTSQRPTLFSSVHMGTSAQAQPILACITLWRIKHPMYTAKRRTASAPESWSSSPQAFVSERLKGTGEDLPSISRNKEINRLCREPCLEHCSCLLPYSSGNQEHKGKQSATGWSLANV